MDTDMMWDVDFFEPDYDKGYWTIKDGKRLNIREMETSHIKNTINMLKRSIKTMDKDFKDYYEDYFNFKIDELEEELRVRIAYYHHIMGESK